jgi:ubiquitin-protein ligase E3 C
LSSSSSEIIDRINIADVDSLEEFEDSGNTKSLVLLPLPPFIKDQLVSLVNKTSITGLLAKFDIDYGKASAAGEEDASLLASYALTLLRIFPSQSDEIRMWLYLGSMTNQSGAQIPPLKFFWQAMSSTSTFSTIREKSKSALAILRSQIQPAPVASSDFGRDREWRKILLFLELYSFVLRFTDDEEFLSGGTQALEAGDEPLSRNRESALALEDVKRLTIFLKNVAFTVYFNDAELSEGDQQSVEGSLGTYLGTHTPSSRFQSHDNEVVIKRVVQRPFAGIAGVTFAYVKTLVTGVMRMLYERDSRRPFLPKDHWLMTSRFDMEGFIPAVVAEEERQHEVRGNNDDGDEEGIDDEQDVDAGESMNFVGMAVPRRAQQIEALRRQQHRAQRKKALAAVGPRLEVLQNMPFSIPFDTRVKIFRQFVFLDQSRRRGGDPDPDLWRMAVMHAGGNINIGQEAISRHHAKIRRHQLFEDAFDQFYELGDGLKEPIQITFVDQFGSIEAGIDGGGVTKEFLTSVTKEVFRTDKSTSLFATNDQNLLYPNPSSLDQRKEFLKMAGLAENSPDWQESIKDLLRQYEFLGRIVGKCLYEGILVDIGFAGFFLLKWATSGATGVESRYRANINDLRDLDEPLYQGLLKLKNYPGDVEDFSLDFTINDTVSLPDGTTQTLTRELIPNGANTPVTNENRPLYVSYVARYRLQIQPYLQTQAFLRGLGEIIKPSWLSMFNQSELQTLIGGDSSEIDVDDLRKHTAYGGAYYRENGATDHATIKIFWQVMKELDDSDRRKVLKYVTSTPRAPLLGFALLNPQFSIRDAGEDEDRLPSTSTCVNLLKLPKYSTAKILREKLLYAVNSGAGFDLS